MKEFVLTPRAPKDLSINYEADLNDQQFAVVRDGDGPALVLAGAGSGKTRTITYRVAWLLEHGVNANNILLLTFTNKAAREMIDRVETLLGPQAQGLWAGTFHSVANRLLRIYAKKLGFDSNFSILDQEDARELITLCVKELKIDTKNKRFPSARVLHAMISFQSNKRCSMEDVLEWKYPNFIPLRGEIESVADLYRTMKQVQNSMDFDDLLLKLLDLLRTDEAVRAKLSQQFQYILVDEFQDTNVVQAEIVKLLSGYHKNVLVVGDDAQSIYSFRAAEIKNILGFPKQYEGASTFRLTKNYRSTPQILSIANAVIANNEVQFEKELEAVVGSGEKPELVPAQSGAQEARYIADQILALREDGMALEEMAVLFRASFHSQALEFELLKRDIPYDYRGGLKFFERAHVKDAVAYLRLIHNPKDLVAWMRVLRMHPGIGLVTAQKLAKLCTQCSDIKEIRNVTPVGGARAAEGWRGFLRVLNDLLNSGGTPEEYIRALASNEDYQDYLEATHPNASERLDDLEQFALFASQEEEIGAFLEIVSLASDYGAERGQDHHDDERLILSTIHQAKGLEWDAVFVIHLNEGSFPHGRAYEEPQGLEEERRLFYVATTRARKRLFLTYPLTSGYDALQIKQPSQFIDELPSSAYETAKLRQPLASSSFGRARSFDDEPTIVLDGLGETISKPSPGSFLRDISDL